MVKRRNQGNEEKSSHQKGKGIEKKTETGGIFKREKEEMTVKRVKGGYATVHCHGKKKGKIIHRFKTKKKAMAQHRAIMASKSRRKKK